MGEGASYSHKASEMNHREGKQLLQTNVCRKTNEQDAIKAVCSLLTNALLVPVLGF